MFNFNLIKKLNDLLFRECLGEGHEPASCANWKNWFEKIKMIKPEECKI